MQNFRLNDLPIKLITFFVRNPDEVLTIEDVARKFEVSYERAQRALARLQQNKFLTRKIDYSSGHRNSIYSIGPHLTKDH